MSSSVSGNHHGTSSAGTLELLHAVPPETVLHILSLTPDSALTLRAASRTLRQIAGDFLEWNKEEIFRTLSHLHAHTLLERCIVNNYVNFTIRISPTPGYTALSFHVSVKREIRALGTLPENSPGTILAPQEILQCSDLIQAAQDSNLERIWGHLRGRILESNPLLAGLPEENVSAQETRTWMQGQANQPVLQRITRLDLDGLQLTWVPEEIGLCTGLQRLYLESNQLVSLPEGTFRGLADLQWLSLNNNQLASLPEGIFRGLAALQALQLDNNQLVSLPEGIFRGLAALQLLSLNTNQLATLPENLFQGLVQLQQLTLFNNHLASLTEERIFRRLDTQKEPYLVNNLMYWEWMAIRYYGIPFLNFIVSSLAAFER